MNTWIWKPQGFYRSSLLAIIPNYPLGEFMLHPHYSGLSISLLTEKEVLPERIPLTLQLLLALSSLQAPGRGKLILIIKKRSDHKKKLSTEELILSNCGAGEDS